MAREPRALARSVQSGCPICGLAHVAVQDWIKRAEVDINLLDLEVLIWRRNNTVPTEVMDNKNDWRG